MAIEIVSTASILVSARENIVNTLPQPSFCTLPILSIRNQSPVLIAFVSRGEFISPEEGYCIWKPHLAAFYSIHTGYLEELSGIRKVGEIDKPIGKGISPIEKLDASYLEKQVKYCELNDKLIAALLLSAIEPELKVRVKEAFLKCCEVVLHPHFDGLLLR